MKAKVQEIIDDENMLIEYGNKINNWTEEIKTEVNQMGEHRVFKKLPMGNVPDDEYQRIPYHFVFDVKFDLRHRARLVAGGNWTTKRRRCIFKHC